MYLGIIFREGLQEVWGHKFRSMLTMLGVVLGVSALLTMFALTEGAARGLDEGMTLFGGLEKVGINDQEPPDEQQPYREISPGRTMQDVKALRKYATLIETISPEVYGQGMRMEANGRRKWHFVAGVEPEFLKIDRHEIAHGRSITPLDLKYNNRVIVVGRGFADYFWGRDSIPLGETILVDDQIFTVVGIYKNYELAAEKRRREKEEKLREKLKEKNEDSLVSKRHRGRGRGQGRWAGATYWKNQSVVVPLSTFMTCFRTANINQWTRQDEGPNFKLDEISFEVKDMERYNEALEEVRTILLKTHRGIEDFRFDTQEERFARRDEAIQNQRVTGGIIAGISLLVGGIGIMNIMLASISERIRDIGIRRAVGAKRFDIFGQILTESTMLAIIGGFLGLAVGMGLIQVVDLISPQNNEPQVNGLAAIISISFATVTGVIAGVYPAFKAANLSPIQALRYE